MDFARYRSLAGWSLERAVSEIQSSGDERFARVSATLVAKHERGWHMPSPALIQRYAEITEGAVTYTDWLAVKDEASKLPEKRLPARKLRVKSSTGPKFNQVPA